MSGSGRSVINVGEVMSGVKTLETQIYLSDNYTESLSDNKIALPSMGLCNCWRDRGSKTAQCCHYSPRWRPRYWLATRTPLGPEKEVTSPRSELPVLLEAAAGGAARTPSAGDRLRGPASKSRQSIRSLRAPELLALLAKYTDAVERQRLLGREKPETYVRRATLLSAVGEHARARADAARACVLSPTSAVAHYRRGVAEFELGSFEAAVGAFVLGLRFSPASTDLLRAREAAMTSLRARPMRLFALEEHERRVAAGRDSEIADATAKEADRLKNLNSRRKGVSAGPRNYT